MTIVAEVLQYEAWYDNAMVPRISLSLSKECVLHLVMDNTGFSCKISPDVDIYGVI